MKTITELTKRMHQALFDHSTAGILVIGADGAILLANPAAEGILGMTQDELTARRFDSPEWQVERVNGEPLATANLTTARALRYGQPVTDVRMSVLCPGGRRVWVDVANIPITDNGNTIGTVAIFNDVTAHVEMERFVQNELQLIASGLKKKPPPAELMSMARKQMNGLPIRLVAQATLMGNLATVLNSYQAKHFDLPDVEEASVPRAVFAKYVSDAHKITDESISLATIAKNIDVFVELSK